MLETAVFLCGAVIMIIELTGSRILAPYLGTSLVGPGHRRHRRDQVFRARHSSIAGRRLACIRRVGHAASICTALGAVGHGGALCRST